MADGLKLGVTAMEPFIRAGSGPGLDVSVVNDKRQPRAIQFLDQVREQIGRLQGVVRDIADEREIKAQISGDGAGRLRPGSRRSGSNHRHKYKRQREKNPACTNIHTWIWAIL